jgi:hypothetical protein
VDEFTLPTDLTTVAEADLDALEAQATEAFDGIAAAPEGEGDLTTMSDLADAIEAIRTERGRRAEAAEQVLAQAEELLRRVHANAEDGEGEAEQAEDAPEADAPEADVTEAEAVEVEVEPELVTAAAPRRIALRRREPVVEAPKQAMTILAAADIPGFSAGGNIAGTTELAKAVTAKARTLSNHSDRVPVASFDLNVDSWIDSDSDAEQAEAVMAAAADPQSLVAAGEWCSPSEPLYDYFGVEGTDGLLDLPTVGVRRGGILVPSALTLPEDLTTITFSYTEANRAAEDTKDCVVVPCPTWEDVRLEADGFCVTAGNLTERTNPELIARYLSLVAAGHLHKMSGKRIASIYSDSTNGGTQPTVGSGGSAILSGVELLATRYRSMYRTPVNAVLEVVLPVWARDAIRSDLAARNGVALLAVTDAEINSFFSARGLRPQFILDWQRLANATAWPTDVDYVVYAAGAWVVGTAGTLDLGVVRDSTLNATNDYTAAWTEEFSLLAQRGPSLKGTTLLSVDGVTACCPTGA